MTIIENKSAYPYITTFKKEPFKSFALKKRNTLGNFYFSEYARVVSFYNNFNLTLLKDKTLNLENVYWFLLLRKYLREDREEIKDELYKFILKCEVKQGQKIGFVFSPKSKQKHTDIWSTYFALASLKLLGLLKTYLSHKGNVNIKKAIKDLIEDHKKNNGYMHCLNKKCPIDEKTSSVRTLYFVFEIFVLLGIDIRNNREEFAPFIGDLKKDPVLVFKLLCLKYIERETTVRNKEIEYLYQFQKENKGFSFKKIEGQVNTTFWMVYALNSYSWLLDYNPMGIYSFINSKMEEILNGESNTIKMMELTKLTILLSTIWEKFIQEIERGLFKQLEQNKYIDLNQIKNTFGLVHGIEEVISYINLNYTFNLRVLDNRIEFKNYLRNLSKGRKVISSEIFERIKNNSIISITDVHKKYKIQRNLEPLKLKEDVIPIVKEMITRNFFKGSIRTKRSIFKTKYLIYLDFYLEKIIVSDTEINLEQLLIEKEKLRDHKNTIYNMILKLKTAAMKTEEEIESYLLIDEINIAKERIKYLIHNTLMDAEFLNENIEISFSEELYYINLQEVLSPEINSWKKQYSTLKNGLKNLELNLNARIEEKEELRSFNKILDQLKEKIENIEEDIFKKIDNFRSYFREILEKEYSDDIFNLLTQEFDKISQRVSKYDKIIYRISQKITTREGKLKRKHKKIIEKWVDIKEEFEEIFMYYTQGFQFFYENLGMIEEINENTNKAIKSISEEIKIAINEDNFEIQKIFDVLKKDSGILLDEKMKEIKILQKSIKKEIKSKQKLYLLYRVLPEKLDKLEEDIIELVAEQVQILKNKALEEINRTKIEDFDIFVNQEMISIRNKLISLRNTLEQLKNPKIKDVIKGTENIQNLFDQTNQQYLKKLESCKSQINDFEEKSSLTIIQWENFKDYLNNEIRNFKDEKINSLITAKINLLSSQKRSNNINIAELKKDLNLSCKVLISRIKDLIEISQINADLYEDEKCILLHTDHFYKNKELKNFMENKILKSNSEAIGKILSLYDSSIKNRTLGINTLELQNRIYDLIDYDKKSYEQFRLKTEELKIDTTRKEYIKSKENFESTIDNEIAAITNIKKNLTFFNKIQSYIDKEYHNLKVELKQTFENTFIDKEKIQDNFTSKDKKYAMKLKETQDKLDSELKLSLNKNFEMKKLGPEIREFFVIKKNEFLDIYNKRMENITDQISNVKNDSFREKLLNVINENKIQLSQLLGNLERSVEDDVEVKFFKRAYFKINRRIKKIQDEIKESSKKVKNQVKKLSKQSKDFETMNRYLIDDFEQFIQNFSEILSEKTKVLERLIIKSYVQTTINAVSNQFLTISFLNEELKIKKNDIQDGLLLLISSGDLKGKYDIRLGIYYENPDALKNVNEEELQVIKKMNFRVYMFLTHLKNFTGQYASIMAMFASILTITYTLIMLTGNFLIASLPLMLTIVFITFLWYKKKKEIKIK